MLKISGNGPVAGTLPLGETWASLMSAVPNLLGAWASGDLASGAVAEWKPRYGSGLLTQTDEAGQPSAGIVSGQQVVNFGAGKRLRLSDSLTSGGPLTIAIRAYLAQPTADNQTLFGGSSSWRARYRSAGSLQMENSSTILSFALSAGWHTIIASQGVSGLTFQVDDQDAKGNASTGAAITALAIGGSGGADATTNWLGLVSRVAIARSGLSGAALNTFRRWVEA